MEMLIVSFLLALSEKDPKMKEMLNEILKFYRENRELLITFSQLQHTSPPAASQNAASANAQSEPRPAAEQTKRSSPLGEESARILEEFLRNKI